MRRVPGAGRLVLGALCWFLGAEVRAQTPAPAERVTFNQAIQRAIERNPSSVVAAAQILRADALLKQARSAANLQVFGNVTTTTLNAGVDFQDTTVSPRNSVIAALDVRMPLYAPVTWARRVQAQDQLNVAELSSAETNRQTALAAADAYLTVIARRRVVDANERARDAAQAHFDLARQQQEMGIGSRLNELRAQQEVSINQGLVEGSLLTLYRAQEALGVLLVADGPVDAADEPAFEIPSDVSAAASTPVVSGLVRTDLRLFAAQQDAADRVLRDSMKDYFPLLQAVFQPQTNYPTPFFTPSNSWRFLLQATVPIFDGGQRAGQRLERQSALDTSRAALTSAMTSIASEVRTARESIASAERALASLNAAADQAREVVNIVNISFRAGAGTNIEVIDADRRALDADRGVAIAEDTLRRARLDLLNALGRFP